MWAVVIPDVLSIIRSALYRSDYLEALHYRCKIDPNLKCCAVFVQNHYLQLAMAGSIIAMVTRLTLLAVAVTV
jgi:hypothetical protein